MEGQYELEWGAVENIWEAAMNTANSLFGILADLLPVLIPVIVIMFAIGFVTSIIKKR